MSYEKLLTYIKLQEKNGFSRQQIKDVLLKAGYKQEVIAEAYNQLNSEHSGDFGEASSEHIEQALDDDIASDQEMETLSAQQALPPNSLQSSSLSSQNNQQQIQTSNQQQTQQGDRVQKYNTLALFSFLFSFTIVLSLLGLILSFIALYQLKGSHQGEKGKNLAIFSMIVSLLFIIVPSVFLFVIMSSLKAFFDYNPV